MSTRYALYYEIWLETHPDVNDNKVALRSHQSDMAQTSVVIPDDLYDLLQQIAKVTGRSISSLCSDFIKDGIYREIENLKKVEEWKQMISEIKSGKKE